jgi:hypothetical protein
MGEDAEWSTSDHLLASILDALNVSNWQRSGGRARRPKPIPRPTDEKPQKFVGSSMTLAQAEAREAERQRLLEGES